MVGIFFTDSKSIGELNLGFNLPQPKNSFIFSNTKISWVFWAISKLAWSWIVVLVCFPM